MDINVSGLTRSFGLVPVLDGIDLRIESGLCVALVGRSGAGKSTLLHLLAGIDTPNAGRVCFGDTDLTALTEEQRTSFRRQHLGLVFQSYNLVPTLTALDNLRLPLELNGATARESRIRAAALLDELGLGELAARYADQLSGGQQQRVAVARALVHQPAVLLADEPTGSLDADNASAVMRLLIGACRERGASLVIATHAQEVMGQADRLLRIANGQLVDA
ncbi:MAG: ABC transporter ATP-binding protein [Lysobacterales bacterium]